MASEADIGKASGIAIGVAALACAEFTPIGSAACATAAAITSAFVAAATWISSKSRDTFDPSPKDAEAWLTIGRLYPMVWMLGIDNTGNDPHQAAKLVRYFRIKAGEVPKGKFGNTGVLFNPNSSGIEAGSATKAEMGGTNAKTTNPYLDGETPDTDEPLADPKTMQRVADQYAAWQKNGSNLNTLAASVTTLHPAPNDQKALLTLIRHVPDAFKSIAKWDTFVKNQPEIAEAVRAARIRSGETGADPQLSAIFGDVTVKAKDPKMAGNVPCCTSCALPHAFAAALGTVIPSLDPRALSPEQAAAWLRGFASDPALLFEGADTAISAPHAADLVRGLRNRAGSADDTCAFLTEGKTLGGLLTGVTQNTFNGNSNRPPTTPASARAYLDLIRLHASDFADAFGEEGPGEWRQHVIALRKLAGETGPDAALAALFGGDVTPGAIAVSDPKMAGTDSGGVDVGATIGKTAVVIATTAAVIGGAWKAYPYIFPPKRPTRR